MSDTTFVRIIADIRERSGLGAKPMLSELAEEIGKMRDQNDRFRDALAKIRDTLSTTAQGRGTETFHIANDALSG